MNGVARWGHAVKRASHLLFAGADVLAATRAGQSTKSNGLLTIAPFGRWLGSAGRAEDVAQGFTIRSTASSPGGHTLIVYRCLGVDRCFSLGRNEAGQLGIGYNSQESTRGLVEDFGEPDSIESVHTTFQTSFIRSLVDGRGVVHAFGSAQRGAAGFGTRPAGDCAQLQGWPKPRLLQLSDAEDIVEIATGFEHTLLLTRSGKLFAMGCSTDGQCGQPELDDFWAPIGIHLPDELSRDHVAGVRAGGDTSAIITNAGRLWTWGNSEYAQAGHGRKHDQICAPTMVISPEGERVVDFQISGSSSIMLRDDGVVKAVGLGALGQGPDTLESLDWRTVELDEPACEIRAGPGYAAAVSSDRRSLYVWGSNGQYGRLGINSRKLGALFPHAHSPVRVDLPLKTLGLDAQDDNWWIQDVQCGVDTMWVNVESESVE